MMVVYETFGIKHGDLDEVAKILKKKIKLKLEPRYGENIGGDYFGKYLGPKKRVDLYYNFNEIDEDWNLPPYDDFPILLELIHPLNELELGEQLPQVGDLDVTLLSRSVWDVDEAEDDDNDGDPQVPVEDFELRPFLPEDDLKN